MNPPLQANSNDDWIQTDWPGTHPGSSCGGPAIAKNHLAKYMKSNSSSTPAEDLPPVRSHLNVTIAKKSQDAWGVDVESNPQFPSSLEIRSITADSPFAMFNAEWPDQKLSIGDKIVEINGQKGSTADLLEALKNADHKVSMLVKNFAPANLSSMEVDGPEPTETFPPQPTYRHRKNHERWLRPYSKRKRQ